ncbi:unnamed protein product, partial [Laminaria digitata]
VTPSNSRSTGSSGCSIRSARNTRFLFRTGRGSRPPFNKQGVRMIIREGIGVLYHKKIDRREKRRTSIHPSRMSNHVQQQEHRQQWVQHPQRTQHSFFSHGQR